MNGAATHPHPVKPHDLLIICGYEAVFLDPRNQAQEICGPSPVG